MPRRPPHHPLHRGLIWRQFAAGTPTGRPLAEWVYITPRYLEGLRQEDLEKETPEKQIETAQIWFLSNYEPFNGQGLGHGSRPHGTLGPQFWSADVIFRDEFAGVIPEAVLSKLATRWQARADFWWFIPDLPPIVSSPAAGGSASPQIVAEAALARLDEAVRAIGAIHGGVGHNQGPPILDVSIQAEIEQATQQAREELAATKADKPAVKEAQNKLSKILIFIAGGLMAGVTEEAGGDIYDPAKHLAIELFHSLANAVTALGHWLSAIIG